MTDSTVSPLSAPVSEVWERVKDELLRTVDYFTPSAHMETVRGQIERSILALHTAHEQEIAKISAPDGEAVPGPSEADINRLEKAAWDSGTDRVLVWYRDQIGHLRNRMREADRFAKSKHQRAIAAESRLSEVKQEIAALKNPRPLSFHDLWEGGRGKQLASSPCEHDQGDSLVVWYDDLLDMKQELDEARARLSEVAAEKEQLKGALDEYASVCVCGCANGDHENYGEDGWCCEHDDHQCIHTSKAVYSIVATLKADQERMREALEGVRSTSRGYPCWCDASHNNVEYDHQPKCQRAIAALSSTPRQE